MDSLIPELPDDIALHCLVRVPRIYHSSLRAVSSAWRQLVDSPLFFSRRKDLGLTDQSLFLLPLFCKPPHALECVEFDLKWKKSKTAVYKHEEIRWGIFLEGHACVSFGRLVMILGGFITVPPYPVSASLRIFDSLTHKWAPGARMGVARTEFAWGVIKDKLYVAGGFGVEKVRGTAEAEAYDFATGTWSRVSSMPFAIIRDLFFVLEGKLFVRGRAEVSKTVEFLSYAPTTDEWREEPGMLDVFKEVPFLTNNAAAAITSLDESVYKVEIEGSRRWPETEPCCIKITKLDRRTLKWTIVGSLLDEIKHPHSCSPSNRKQVKSHGLSEKVLVVHHHSREKPDIVVRERDQIREVSLPCPSMWSTTLINA